MQSNKATKRVECLVTPLHFEKLQRAKAKYKLSGGLLLRAAIDMLPIDDNDTPETIVIKKKS